MIAQVTGCRGVVWPNGQSCGLEPQAKSPPLPATIWSKACALPRAVPLLQEANVTKGVRRCPCFWKGRHCCTSAPVLTGRGRRFGLPTCVRTRLSGQVAVTVRLTASRSAGEEIAPSLAMPHREAQAGWADLSWSYVWWESQAWAVFRAVSSETLSSHVRPPAAHTARWTFAYLSIGLRVKWAWGIFPQVEWKKKVSVAYCH